MATGAEIERLLVRIEADPSGLAAGIARARAELDKGERAMSASSGRLVKIFGQVTGASSLMAGGVGAAAAAVIAATKVAVKYADGIYDAAAAAGVGTDALQELRYAAVQNGVASEQLDGALAKLTTRIGAGLRDVSSDAAKEFRRLGIELVDARGNVRGTDDVLGDISSRLAKMGSQAERSAALADLLGEKLGPRLVAFLGKGRSALDELREAARKTGAVMDEAMIERSAQAQDELEALTLVTKAQLTAALADLAPALVTITGGLADIARGANVASVALGALFGRDASELDGEIESLDKKAKALRRNLAAQESGAQVFFTKEQVEEAKAELHIVNGLLSQAKERQLQLLAAQHGGGKTGEGPRPRPKEDPEERKKELEKLALAEQEAADKTSAAVVDTIMREIAARTELRDLHAKQVYEAIELNQKGLESMRELHDQGRVSAKELADFEGALYTKRYETAKGALSDLASLTQSQSRKMFEVGKAAAIAETVINTYEGAQKAYTALADIPIVGPALGAAAALAAVAAGTARVQAIRSTTFNSGGAPRAVGGLPATGGDGNTGFGGTPGSGPQGPNVYATFHGSQLYSGRQLVEQLNDALKDGARLAGVQLAEG